MQILLFNFTDDLVDPLFKAIAIRMSYLISEQLKLVGDLNYLPHAEKDMRNMPMDKKLKMIIHYDKELTGEQKENFIAGEKATRIMTKMKHKNKEILVRIKKTEAAINTHFQFIMEDILQPYKVANLLNFGELEEKEGYGYYPVVANDTEKVHPDMCRLSEVLQMELDDEDLQYPTALLLNYPFFVPYFEKEHNVTVPPFNEFTTDGFIVPIMNFYNVSVFSIADCDVLKNNVKQAFQSFQHAIETFISLRATPEAAFDCLHQQLKPCAENLQTELDNTSLMKNYIENRFKGLAQIILTTGMLPWKIIYEYFKYSGLIRDKTLDIINSITPPAEWMPVLILKFPIKADHPQPVQQQDRLQGSKKSLEL